MAELGTLIASRIVNLLGDEGASWPALGRAEVEQFLRAGEYGLAVDRLAWILGDARKPISRDMLREIESLIAVMDPGREPFVSALRAFYQGLAAENPLS